MSDDITRLEEALKNEPLDLRTLRVVHGIEPTVGGYLRRQNPERIIYFEKDGKAFLGRRQPPLSARRLKLVKIIKAINGPVSFAKLAFYRYSEDEVTSLATEHPDVATVVEPNGKKSLIFTAFLQAVVPAVYPAIPEPPAELEDGSGHLLPSEASRAAVDPPALDSDVAADAAHLILLLSPGWRTNRWLSSMNFPMHKVEAVSKAYPKIFLITEETSTVGYFEWRISLAPQTVEPAPEDPEDSAVAQRVPDPPVPISDEEYLLGLSHSLPGRV